MNTIWQHHVALRRGGRGEVGEEEEEEEEKEGGGGVKRHQNRIIEICRQYVRVSDFGSEMRGKGGGGG